MKNIFGTRSSRAFVESISEQFFSLRLKPGASSARGMALGKNPETCEIVRLSDDALKLGALLVGPPGRGKSIAIRQIVRQLVRRKLKKGHGFALIDPHGDTASWALQFIAATAPELAPQVYYLDFRQQQMALSLNVLRASADPAFIAASFTEAALKAHSGQLSSTETPLLRRVLALLFETLCRCDLTIADYRWFLQRGPSERGVSEAVLARLPNGRDAQQLTSFWNEVSEMPAAVFNAHVLGPLNRLQPLNSCVSIRRMLGNPAAASLDFLPVMDDGSIVIVDASIHGGTNVSVDAQRLFLGILVQSFRVAFAQRTPNKSRPFTLVMDEFAQYCPGDFGAVWSQSRKFGLEVVAALQGLSMLELEAGDVRLVQAAKAIPNRMIFGGLPLDETKMWAELSFLAQIDPDQVKYQGTTPIFEPVPTKVRMTSTSESESEGEVETDAESQSENHAAASGNVVDADGNITSTSNSEARGSGSGRSSTRGTQRSRTRGSTITEQYVTFFKKELKADTPVYRQIEEQLFIFAQRMHLAPTGICTFVSLSETPVPCMFPHRKDLDLSVDDMQRFLDAVFDKPVYSPPSEIDRLLEERNCQLLEAGEPQVTVLESPFATKRKTKVRSTK